MKWAGITMLVLSVLAACGAPGASSREAAAPVEAVDIPATPSSASANAATLSAPPAAGSSIEPSASDLFILHALGGEQSSAVDHAIGTLPDSQPLPDGVTVGGAAVSGGSIANAASVVAGLRPCFETCFKKGLVANPQMRGSMRITAAIGTKGEVSSATPAGAGGLTDALRDCAVACVSSAHFAPPVGASSMVVVPVAFIGARPPTKSSGDADLHLGTAPPSGHP